MMEPDSNSVVPALHPSAYTSDAVFHAERECIFMREWTVVGPLASLSRPGAWLTTQIAGKSVVVINAADNSESPQVRAYLNTCRHRASSLVDPRNGSGTCNAFRCPYHGWVYDLDGSLRSAPGFDDSPAFDRGAMGLVSIRTDVWNGIVFACLAPDGPPLLDWLGDVITIAREFPGVAGMRFDHAVSNTGETDWKTYSDNSAEGYHLEYVHPALSRAVAPGAQIRAWPNGRFVGFDVTYRDDPTDTTGANRGFWIYKFPGILLHFSETGFNMERVTPLAPGRSQLDRWFWSLPQLSGEDVQAAIDASSAVMAEDLAICENVQRNLDSGSASRGVLSTEREPGTVYFQQLVREAHGCEPGEQPGRD